MVLANVSLVDDVNVVENSGISGCNLTLEVLAGSCHHERQTASTLLDTVREKASPNGPCYHVVYCPCLPTYVSSYNDLVAAIGNPQVEQDHGRIHFV